MFSFLTGKKTVYTFRELEALSQQEFYTFFEEIPSGDESDIDDASENEDETGENQTFDINAMDIVFAENLAAEDLPAEEWDSEDDTPLATIQAELIRAERRKNTTWTQNPQYVNNVQTQSFSSEIGPNIPEDLETPTDIFLHLFPDTLIQHIAFQTNLYALQKNGGNYKFEKTNPDEIKAFIAINLFMGIKRLPSYRDYWSSRLELRDNFVSSIMSRDRFDWLLANVHLNDNQLQPAKGSPLYDKLYKVRPLLDNLSETFLHSCLPSKNQAIDESMIRFKGRSSLRQYMPLKPIKRGYKVWIRAGESGYVHQFQIYVGKTGDDVEKSLGSRVVKDLTRSLVGKYHTIYFDNFFNSVELMKNLHDDAILACGTFRKGRKDMPNDLKEDKSMKRGDSDWRVSTCGLSFLKWKDRKAVYFLSNFQDPSVVVTTSRKNKDGTYEEIPCPVLVKDYNGNMGFVDKMDMLKSLYEVDRKSKKWWHRIMFHFIDLALVNAFILFKERSDGKSETLKLFRLSVIMGLTGASVKSKKGKPVPINNFKPTVAPEIRFDKCAHLPLHGKSRRCAECSTRAEPHRTVWSCTVCNVGLCLGEKKNCFAKYHSK